MDYGFQHFFYISTCFCRNVGGVAGVQTDDILDFRCHPLRLRAGEVDFIDNRKHIQVMVQGQVHVGQGLGLDSLGGVHHQYGSVAGSQAS